MSGQKVGTDVAARAAARAQMDSELADPAVRDGKLQAIAQGLSETPGTEAQNPVQPTKVADGTDASLAAPPADPKLSSIVSNAFSQIFGTKEGAADISKLISQLDLAGLFKGQVKSPDGRVVPLRTTFEEGTVKVAEDYLRQAAGDVGAEVFRGAREGWKRDGMAGAIVGAAEPLSDPKKLESILPNRLASVAEKISKVSDKVPGLSIVASGIALFRAYKAFPAHVTKGQLFMRLADFGLSIAILAQPEVAVLRTAWQSLGWAENAIGAAKAVKEGGGVQAAIGQALVGAVLR